MNEKDNYSLVETGVFKIDLNIVDDAAIHVNVITQGVEFVDINCPLVDYIWYPKVRAEKATLKN